MFVERLAVFGQVADEFAAAGDQFPLRFLLSRQDRVFFDQICQERGDKTRDDGPPVDLQLQLSARVERRLRAKLKA